MLWDLAQSVFGVVLLYFGGEWLVKGATQLANALSVGRIVIGLTVVAFGTSAPELAASLFAAYSGVPEVAYGNVVGSNVANIGLILGAAALLAPLTTTLRFLLRQVPFMILATVIGLAFAWDGRLARIEGLLLVALLAVYVGVLFRTSPEELAPEGETKGSNVLSSVLVTAAGIGLLTLGAQVLIQGATGMAVAFGVSKRVIGMTLVAVGTSIPELAAAIVATAKREHDLVLGNIVGSNIFNFLAVFGATAAVHPFRFGAAPTGLEIVGLMGFPIAMIPLMIWKLRIGKLGGAILLAGYALYLARLWSVAGGQ